MTLFEGSLGRGGGPHVWTPMSVRVDEARILHVSLGGIELTPAGGVRLLGYAPSVAWRFGWGASAGAIGDWHMLDAIRVRAGGLLLAATAPLEVSLGGVNFESVPGGFVYHTPIVLSTLVPSASPVRGGARLTVHGYGLAFGTQPECRIGQVHVRATLVNGSAMLCESPPEAQGVTAAQIAAGVGRVATRRSVSV